MFKRLIPFLLMILLALPCVAEEASPLATEMPVVEDVSAGLLDDQPEVVRDVQQHLSKLGFYVGAIDGKYGKYSEDAVRAFQAQFGLEETGHLDARTVSLMMAYAEKGITKKAIQQRLIDMGYLQSKATGYMGPQTEGALRLFQQINGLEETGRTDTDTMDALFSDHVVTLPPAVSAGSSREDIVKLQTLLIRFGFMSGEPVGEYGRQTTAAVQAFQQHLIDQGRPVEKTGAASPITLYYLYDGNYSSYVKNLSAGASGGEVRRVETRLAALGYLDEAADDTFDGYTKQALGLFQQKSGLKASGIANRKTIDALFSDGAVALPAGVSSDSRKREIVKLQKQLIRFGFMEGEAVGEYGSLTADAVQAFQQHLMDQGYPVRATGSASPLTVYYLCDEDYSTYLEDVTEGMTGGEAARIETRLASLGYLDRPAGDAFDGFSKKALALFQKASGLEESGVADRATVDCLFSGKAAALPAGVSPDSDVKAVTALQKGLMRYGFMAGEADGAYGEATTEAVRSFQQRLIDQGYPIEATGIASPLTACYLRDEAYSSYLRDVTPGMTGDEAMRVETRLAALGYLDAGADDTFDDYAQEALALFQREAGLEESGTGDRGTIDALFGEAVAPADHCAPHEISSGDSGLAVREVQKALLVAGYTIQQPDGKFGANMEKGLKSAEAFLSREDSATHLTKQTVADFQSGLLSNFISPDVYRLQRRLHTLFYLDKSSVDGVKGETTMNALHMFQFTNGLPETDGTDNETLSLLYSDAAIAKRYAYRVEVSIDRQVVDIWALNPDNEYVLAQSFTCSTGLHNSTPRGIFLKGFPQDRWHYFKKFMCWAQYSFVIEGDILFHSVIYGRKNENSLHRSSVRNLGNPASHGCVRLTVEDAKWLYEHCQKGSLVIVIS